MTQLMLFASEPAGQAGAELRFVHRSHHGKSLAFPCDTSGRVDLDALDERSRNRYLFARALMGRDYGFPIVTARRQ